MPRFLFEVDVHETAFLEIEADDEDEAKDIAQDFSYVEEFADWDHADRAITHVTYRGPVTD